MNIHKLRTPTRKHRYDKDAKDFTRQALLNLFDGFQRFKEISHLVDLEKVEHIELALNTACLYIIYSQPSVIKSNRERRLMALSVANAAGGEK